METFFNVLRSCGDSMHNALCLLAFFACIVLILGSIKLIIKCSATVSRRQKIGRIHPFRWLMFISILTILLSASGIFAFVSGWDPFDWTPTVAFIAAIDLFFGYIGMLTVSPRTRR